MFTLEKDIVHLSLYAAGSKGNNGAVYTSKQHPST